MGGGVEESHEGALGHILWAQMVMAERQYHRLDPAALES